MKKKLLFLLLLLVPFMVKADVRNFNLKWKVEEKDNVFVGSYRSEHAFIFFGYDTMVSVDKLTGAQTETAIPNNSHHALVGNHILVGSKLSMTDGIKYRIYDEYLNYLNKFTINDMYIIHADVYKDDYLVVVGYVMTDPDPVLTARYYDQNGTLVRTETMLIENGLYTRAYDTKNRTTVKPQAIFMDFNSNSYVINDFKIEPVNKNSDGSFMFLNNDHLYKVSSDNEELGSIEIPNGKGTRMIKKGDKYYIATGVYETDDEDNTSIGLNLYIVDENLNIVKTGSIDAPDYTTNNEVPSNGFNDYVHTIYYDEMLDKVVTYICIDSNSGYYCFYYILDENLNATTDDDHYFYYPFIDYDDAWYSAGLNALPGLYLHNIKDVEEITAAYPNAENLYGTIYDLYKNDENFEHIDLIPDGNNTIVAEYFGKCEGEGCTQNNGDLQASEKIDLVYLDSNKHEIFRKTIYDWHVVNERVDGNSTSNYDRVIFQPYENNIALVATSSQGNIFRMYDRQGNVVKDFSLDLSEYIKINAFDIYGTDKGIYLSLMCDRYYAYIKGVSEWYPEKSAVAGAFAMLGSDSKNSLKGPLTRPGLGGPENGIYSVVMYYSTNFNITTQIKGKGTITATPEKADEGEPVKFTVTPDPGYVLSLVKVIDSNGNVVTYTNDTFVMPASDVIIEATFVPVNPNTGDVAILIIVLITIASAFILITQKKKLNNLK